MTCMFIIGSLYAAGAVHGDHGAARWVVIVMIYIFAIVFCATWAVSFRVYISEIQPAKTRAGAASLATSANWVSSTFLCFILMFCLNMILIGNRLLTGSWHLQHRFS